MKKLIMGKYRIYKAVMEEISEHHIGAYAAQSAFFIVLSLIPFLLLLMTMIQYTNVTEADVLMMVTKIFPKTIYPTVVSIVNQVYSQSRAMIPVTALVTIWSAGRGVLAISAGLNCVYGSKETRNYIYLRLRAAFYTVLFIVAIVLSLVILVFGDRLSILLISHFPILRSLVERIINIRVIVSFVILTAFSMILYYFLPNRRNRFWEQMPGALVMAVGWSAASYIFSEYLNIFTGFSGMYGSMTTIVLIMLWLYACMYILLLGGQLNVLLKEGFFAAQSSR